MSFFAALEGAKFPSLDSILDVGSSQEPAFDEKQDAFLEKKAKELLAKNQAAAHRG